MVPFRTISLPKNMGRQRGGSETLPRDRGAEDLSAEKATLRALNNLLINGHGWVVHNDSSGLIVNLGVNTCVADEVDDPFLALRGGETQTFGEVPKEILISAIQGMGGCIEDILDVDPLVNLAVGF